MTIENELDFTVPHNLSVDLPNLSDYFGIWSIEESAFRTAVERCNGLNLHAHIAANGPLMEEEAAGPKQAPVTKDGIAIFNIEGPTMKRTSSLSGGTSTIRLRQQIRAARKSPDVLGGLLVMDTPGGTVKGNRDLADEVAAFAAVKPLYQFTEDMVASAGVSVASMATKRFANNGTALYGAMGTYAVVLDYSGQAEQLGVKVHVIRAGQYKGMGEPGTEITPEQLAEMQRIVSALNEGYIETIARGLNKDKAVVRAFADGRIHTANDALEMGLITGIQTYDETYAQLVAESRGSLSTRSRRNMSQDVQAAEPKAATLAELKKTFPKSSAEWRESQLEAGATLSDAAIAYAGHVQEQADKEKEDLQKQLDEEKAKSKTAKQSTEGHQPVSVEGQSEYEGGNGDPVSDFDVAVAKAAGPNPTLQRRNEAIRLVAKRQPELYEAYLLATNDGGKRQTRLISEKLEAAKQ